MFTFLKKLIIAGITLLASACTINIQYPEQRESAPTEIVVNVPEQPTPIVNIKQPPMFEKEGVCNYNVDPLLEVKPPVIHEYMTNNDKAGFVKALTAYRNIVGELIDELKIQKIICETKK